MAAKIFPKWTSEKKRHKETAQKKHKKPGMISEKYQYKTGKSYGIDFLERGVTKRTPAVYLEPNKLPDVFDAKEYEMNMKDRAEKARLEQELIGLARASKKHKTKLPTTGKKIRFEISNKGPEKYRTEANNYNAKNPQRAIGNGWEVIKKQTETLSDNKYWQLPDIFVALKI